LNPWLAGPDREFEIWSMANYETATDIDTLLGNMDAPCVL
jgi:hypothetical protein